MRDAATPWAGTAANAAVVRNRTASDVCAATDGIVYQTRNTYVRSQAGALMPSDALQRVVDRNRAQASTFALADGFAYTVQEPALITSGISMHIIPLGSGNIDSRYPRAYGDMLYIADGAAMSDGAVSTVWSASGLDKNLHIGHDPDGDIDSTYVYTPPVNYAPLWTGAPATLTFTQGVGGTYAFAPFASDPDADTFSYSLVGVAYSGISINAASGLLTVTAAAAAAVRALTVRIADPDGLYADHGCSVTITTASVVRPAATIIVRTSGGTVDGLPTYTTINAAIAAASAGSVIEIVAATGTSQTIAQTITITKSGSSGNPITLRVRDGYSIMLSVSTSGSLLTMTGANYWIIEGNSTGRTGLVFGNPAQHNPSDPEGVGAASYAHKRTATLTTCTYIGFRNLTLHGSAAYEAVRTYRDCSHIAFDNVKADLHGTIRAPESIYGPDNYDVGDLLWLQAPRTRITNSLISRSGHSPISANCPWFVLRDSEVHNDWTSIYSDDGQGLTGYRCVELVAGRVTKWSPSTVLPSQYGPQCVENCNLWSDQSIVWNSTSAVGVQFTGRGLIVRGNTIHDLGWAPFLGPGYGGARGGQTQFAYAVNYGFKAYHNTTYGTKSVLYGSTYDHLNPPERDEALERLTFINNIFQDVQTGIGTRTKAFTWDAYGGVSPDGNLIPVNGWSNSWKGGKVWSNVFAGPSTDMNIRMIGTGGTSVAVAATAWQESNKASYYCVQNNSVATVSLTSTSKTSDSSRATSNWRPRSNFSLTSGTGIGDAEPLTSIASSSTGTTITVADAWFFKDSWGMDFADKLGAAFPNEVGDYIAIGNSAATATIRQITGINYDAGTIGLSAPVTATAGMGVWLASASAVCDNRGAIQ